MKKILILTAVVSILFACSKVNTPGYQNMAKEHYSFFYATAETTPNPETKVYLDDDLKLLWNENDSISIFNMNTYNNLFLFEGSDGDNAGGFMEIPAQGFIAGNLLDHIFAIYPYKPDTKINNSEDKITYTLPSVQVYREHSFGVNSNLMVAATDNNFLAFKNACGYLKFRFYGDNTPISSITIQGNNGEKIAGKAYITPAINGVPTTIMDEDYSVDTLSILCDNPVTIGNSAENSTEFCFVIPPVTFTNGFTIIIKDNMGGSFVKSTTKSLTISRNTMESMSPIKVTMSNGGDILSFDSSHIKSKCVASYDINGDGEISLSEANAVSVLNLDAYYVESYADLKYFRNLKILHITTKFTPSASSYRYLDLTYNTNLEELFCNAYISSLNVSNNKKLRVLDCSNEYAWNKITTLDVSNNPELIVLRCHGNQISSLDLSHNPNLVELYCWQSNKLLDVIDLSNNQKLSYAYLFMSGKYKKIILNTSHAPIKYYVYNGTTPPQWVDVTDNLSGWVESIEYVD